MLPALARLGEHKAQLILVAAVRRLREIGIACAIVLAGDGLRRPDLHHGLDLRRLREGRDNRCAGSGAAELFREDAGRHHGGDSARPSGHINLYCRHTGTGPARGNRLARASG